MKFALPGLFLFSLLFSACIGDDLVFDRVPEELRLINGIDSLEVGDTHQFEVKYFNNVGIETAIQLDWTSETPNTASVDQNGVVTALAEGAASIRVSVVTADTSLQQTMSFSVSAEPIMEDPDPPVMEATGTIAATSFYTLEGDFILTQDGNNLVLSFSGNYEADTALPGLYVYLTNNPNTSNGAFEIGPVSIFSGTHSYTIAGSDGFGAYSHVLYYCKPFNVKVGDGVINY
ncbi:MAG: Ig-like domain-containing protein [Bacteroidota bacterium]